MKREEAIMRIKQNKAAAQCYAEFMGDDANIKNGLLDMEAFDIAIEAIQKETERQEMVIRASERHLGLVRCKDCRWYEDPRRKIFENCVRGGRTIPMQPTDYCSYGERREVEK